MKQTEDMLLQKLEERWREVTELPPQAVGPFTPMYKWCVKRLKIMPWPALVMSSAIMVLLLFAIFGSAVTFLVNLLQRGF